MPWRAVTVTSITSEIAGYSPTRKSLAIANNGNGTIFFSQDPSNVLARGMPLGVGQVAVLVKDEGDEPDREVFAVSLGTDQDVRVEESVGP